MDLLAYALVAVVTALTVLALAGVARRLLGLRFGIVRTLLAGVLLLGTTGGPAVTTRLGLYQLLGYFLLVISSVLVLRVLVLIFRRNT